MIGVVYIFGESICAMVELKTLWHLVCVGYYHTGLRLVV